MPENEKDPADINMNELRRSPSPENSPAKNVDRVETSEAVEEAKRSERETRKGRLNVEDLVKWLAENKVDPDFVGKLKEAVLQAESGDKKAAELKNLDETLELLQKLPKYFENFSNSLDQLKEKPGFSEAKLKDKRAEIIKGMCLSVSNGHLTSEDALSCVKGIEIISQKNNPKEKQDAIDRMLAISGYDAVLYIDNGKIVIFEESLVDDFKTTDNRSIELDFKHLMNHELSHSLVEKALHRNKQLSSRVNEIIAQASELKDLQSQHVINTLDGLARVKADFEADFADNEAKSEAYLALDDAGKTKAKEIAEKAFIDKRNRIAADEIMTDYTAIYLQSSGTLESFCQVCLQKVDHKKFAECLGAAAEEIRDINNCKTQEEKGALLEKLKERSPKFGKALEIYTSLFHEIKKTIAENKGQFYNLESDEDELSREGLGGFGAMPETAGNFAKNEGGNPDGVGVSSEFFALIAAMADEVAPNEVAGGQIPG